jgi:hypothetical protein
MLAICLTLISPALAAEDTFVPSISYKDGPDIIDAEMDEEDVKDCLVVTTLKAATEKTTDVYQATRDLLLNIYEDLKNDNMKLPIEGGYIVRELVDVSWKKTNCVENITHDHDKELEKEGVVVNIVLDMRLSADYDIAVFAYRNGQWGPIEKAEINSDGSVTCVFEHFCPVAFCVRERTGGSDTGDPAGRNLIVWIALMAVSAATILFLIIKRRKRTR